MADLSSLMRISPAIGAYFAGQNQQSDLEKDAAYNQYMQAMAQSQMGAESRANAMQPYKLTEADIKNRHDEADLPRIIAAADLEGQKATKGKATLQSDIASTNLSNNIKMQQQILGEMGTISQGMQSVPDVDKPRYFMEQAQARGIPDPEGLLKKFQHLPVGQIPAAMQALVQRQLENNPDFVKEKYKTDADNATRVKTTGMTVQGQKDVEQMRIDAGKYNRKAAVDNVEARLLKAKSAAEKAEILESAYYEVANKDPELASVLRQRALDARARAAEDARQKGLAKPGLDIPQVTGLPAQESPTATAPIAGVGSAGTAGTPAAPQHNLAEVQKQYPGVPPAKLKELYKKKFGVDLK